MQDKVGLVLDDPFDNLTSGKLHSAGHSCREINIPLQALLTLDELDLCRVAHSDPPFYIYEYN